MQLKEQSSKSNGVFGVYGLFAANKQQTIACVSGHERGMRGVVARLRLVVRNGEREIVSSSSIADFPHSLPAHPAPVPRGGCC